MQEESLTVAEICELTGLEPERVRSYIRLGRLRGELAGSAFAEDYRVKRSELMKDPEIRELIAGEAAGEQRAGKSGTPAGEADLMKLVDRYKAMLDEISRCKLRAAGLGGSAASARVLQSDLEKKTREAEELEREINELRGKILAREGQIRGLGAPRRKGGKPT